MISGLRRSITPSAPTEKRIALRITYHWMSGPRIALRRVLALARVRAEDDAADRGHEQHDRRDLEREQVIGEKEPADRSGEPNDACRSAAASTGSLPP